MTILRHNMEEKTVVPHARGRIDNQNGLPGGREFFYPNARNPLKRPDSEK